MTLERHDDGTFTRYGAEKSAEEFRQLRPDLAESVAVRGGSETTHSVYAQKAGCMAHRNASMGGKR